jgi:hypothetical protein
MPIVQIILVLVVVGVLLWVVNTFLSPYIDGKILGLINAVVVVACVLWLLFILLGMFGVGTAPLSFGRR